MFSGGWNIKPALLGGAWYVHPAESALVSGKGMEFPAGWLKCLVSDLLMPRLQACLVMIGISWADSMID